MPPCQQSFLDANIFIRYFTNDDPEKADRVEKLLDLAERLWNIPAISIAVSCHKSMRQRSGIKLFEVDPHGRGQFLPGGFA